MLGATNDSPDSFGWKREPERSAAGAVVGLVMAWLVGGALVLGMVEIQPGTAPVSRGGFMLWMSAPLAIGSAACTSRRVRSWRGAIVPGAVVGWLLGLLTFLGLALLVVAI